MIAVLALAGCAELRWDKPGADEAAVLKDLETCRGEARLRMARSTVLAPPVTVTVPVPGPDGRTVQHATVVSQPSSASLAIEEQEIADRCMRDKGYHLVPATPPPR